MGHGILSAAIVKELRKFGVDLRCDLGADRDFLRVGQEALTLHLLVASRVLAVVLAQDSESVRIDNATNLLTMARIEAGFDDAKGERT